MKKRNLLTLILSVALLGVNLNVNAMKKRNQPDKPFGQSRRQEKRQRAEEGKKEGANVLKKIGKAVQPTIDLIRRKKKQEAEEKVKQIQGRINGLSSKLATPVCIQRSDSIPKPPIHPGPPGPPPHRPTIPTPRDVPSHINQRQAPQGLFQMIEHILSMNPSEISYDYERLLHDHPEIVQQIKHQKLFRSVESALSIPQHERSCEAERFLDDHSDVVDHIRRQQHERMERDRQAHFHAQQRRRSIAEDRIRVALKKSWHSSDDRRLFDEFPDLTNAINEEFAQKKLAKKEAQRRAVCDYSEELIRSDFFKSEDLRRFINKSWKHLLSRSYFSWSGQEEVLVESFPRNMVLFLDDDVQDAMYKRITSDFNSFSVSNFIINGFSEDILKALEKQVQEKRKIDKQKKEIEQERKRLLEELKLAQQEFRVQEVELEVELKKRAEQEVALKELSEQKQKLEKFAEREGKLKNVLEQEIILKKIAGLEVLLTKLVSRDLILTELEEIESQLKNVSSREYLKKIALSVKEASLKKLTEAEADRLKRLSENERLSNSLATDYACKFQQLSEIEAKSGFMTFISTIINFGSEKDDKLKEIKEIDAARNRCSSIKIRISKELAEAKEAKLREKADQQVAILKKELAEINVQSIRLKEQQDLTSKEISMIEAIPKKFNEQKDERFKKLAEIETKLAEQENRSGTKPFFLRCIRNGGLGNIRTNCYLNVATQCFLSLPGFRGNLLQNEDSYKNDPVVSKLIRIIKNLIISEHPITDSDFINSAVNLMLSQPGNAGRPFQDAQEFISLLLARLDQAATQSLSMSMNEQIKCSGCGYESGHPYKDESGAIKLDLTLQPQPLERLLNNYFTTVQLNDYTCDNCHVKKTTTKTNKISIYPNELIITFNRLNFDIETRIQKPKNNVPIEFSEHLDLKPYATPELQQQEVNSLYELCGIICHEGAHYFSYVKDFQDEKWYLYNDTSIESVSERDIQNIITKSSLPYVLFYKSKMQQQLVQPMQVDPTDSGFDSSDDEADLVAFAEPTTFRGEGKF